MWHGALVNYMKENMLLIGGKCTNANSLNIEMCNSVGKVPNDVYKQTVELTKYYMKKYGVPVSHITDHYRVAGKCCPEPWASPNSKRGLLNSKQTFLVLQ